MIDAKRLAELMEPEKMKELAEFLEARTRLGVPFVEDAMDCAAAVLREMATRLDIPKDAGVIGGDAARPNCGLCGNAMLFGSLAVNCEIHWVCACGEYEEITPANSLEAAAAVLRAVASAKVIEVDTTDPAKCRFCQYEQGICFLDLGRKPRARSCVQGSGPHTAAPEWCPARDIVIIQAKLPK